VKTKLRAGFVLLALLALLAGCRKTPTPEPTFDLGDIGSRAGSPRERICISCADDSYMRHAGTLYFYSDNLATQTLALGGSSGDVTLATGDLALTAGDLTLAAGDTTLTAGNLVVTAGDATVTAGDLTMTAGDIDLTAGNITAAIGVEHLMFPTVASTSITYTAAAGGTGAAFTVGDGEIWLVHAVFAQITTDFDCTGDDATLVVGDGNDADGFLVLADAELQTSDTEGTGWAAGWQGQVPATQGAYLDAAAGGRAFVYAPSGADETIDWLVDEASGETLSAGAATIYIVYTRIQ